MSLPLPELAVLAATSIRQATGEDAPVRFIRVIGGRDAADDIGGRAL